MTRSDSGGQLGALLDALRGAHACVTSSALVVATGSPAVVGDRAAQREHVRARAGGEVLDVDRGDELVAREHRPVQGDRLVAVHHPRVVPAERRVAQERLDQRHREGDAERGRGDDVGVARGARGRHIEAHGSALADGEGELPDLLPADAVGRRRRQRLADERGVDQTQRVSRWSRCMRQFGQNFFSCEPVGVVAAVLLGDVVAVLALLARQRDLRPDVRGLGHRGCLLSVLRRLRVGASVAAAGLEPATQRL